jgi:undecaprenyl-diphosphatase
MTYFEAILLGIIQGLTEFLPVSSSGHLVLAQHLLGAKIPGVTFELAVHFGTLLSVLIYFRKKLFGLIRGIFVLDMTAERRMILYLILGTLPAAIFGVLFKDSIEKAFSSPVMTSLFLLATGIILLATGLLRRADRQITAIRSLIIGIGQAIAILPGISRSGSTISAGLFAGIRPSEAAEFSFLLSIPAIAGAILFKIKDFALYHDMPIGQYAAATAASFIFGLAAVYFLLDMIKRGKFKYFGIYCLIAGLIALYHFI